MASADQKQRAPVRATPALDPRVPTLVQPWKRMVEEGLIEELNVAFSPSGVTTTGKPGDNLIAVDGSGLAKGTAYPLGKLLAVAELGKLITKPGQKGAKKEVAAPKPAKSLVKSDLEATATSGLQARINSIAAACGGGPLVGRVRSAGKFVGTETTTYQAWWAAASGDLRALSLSVGKNYSSFTAEEKNRLLGLNCPFRGTLEFKVAEEGDAPQAGQVPPAPDVADAADAGTVDVD